jgi:DNA-binding MurR/RpiR family transcriptional regulator
MEGQTVYIIKEEIDSQFGALSQTTDYILEQEKPILNFLTHSKKVVVFGCGSSFSLAKGYALQLSGIAGIPATALAAGDYLVNSEDYAKLIQGASIISISRSGSTSEIVYSALPIDDPKVRQPDIARAEELLGWEPVVTLREGLQRTVEFERTNRPHVLTGLG